MSMIKGLHHVSMKTVNENQYAEAKRFYAEILGLSIIKECDACILLNSGNGIVEIFRDGTETLPQGTIRHFAFDVDDVDKCIEAVRAEGYEVFVEPKNVFIGGDENFPARIGFCKGPLGEDIEFFCQKW